MSSNSPKIDLNNLDKSDWKTYRFDEICQSISERIDPTTTDLETYIGLEHLDSESIHIRRTGKPADVKGQKLRFYPGDVIFGKRRAYQRKAAVATMHGFCSAHAMVLRANPEVIDPELFPFFLHSDTFMDRAVDISVGSLSPTINWKTLSKQKYVIPAKDVQTRLTELLQTADKLIVSHQSLTEAAKLFTDIHIEHNLTSPDLPGSLTDYCAPKGIRIGPFGSLLHKRDYAKEGIPVVMPADIIDGKIETKNIARISKEKALQLKNYRLRENDILFPRRGDLSKRLLVTRDHENWICGTGTIRVRLQRDINPQIVYFALTSASTNRHLLESSVGTTMPNLNASSIANIPIRLPEGRSMTVILNNLKLAMESKEQIRAKAQTTRRLLKSILNRIF